MTITWEEPPPLTGGNPDYPAIARQLRERPGQWAKTGQALGHMAMRRMYYGLRTHGVQTSRRMSHDGETYDLYARWPENQ